MLFFNFSLNQLNIGIWNLVKSFQDAIELKSKMSDFLIQMPLSIHLQIFLQRLDLQGQKYLDDVQN